MHCPARSAPGLPLTRRRRRPSDPSATQDPAIPQKIVIATVDGEKVDVTIERAWNGALLREVIERQLGREEWPASRQRLVYDGRELDSDLTLASQSLPNGATVYLLRRKVELVDELTPETRWDFRLCVPTPSAAACSLFVCAVFLACSALSAGLQLTGVTGLLLHRRALYIFHERAWHSRGWVKQWERNVKGVDPYMSASDFLDLLKKEAGSIGKYGFLKDDKLALRDVHYVKSKIVPEGFWGAPLQDGAKVKDLGLSNGNPLTCRRRRRRALPVHALCAPSLTNTLTTTHAHRDDCVRHVARRQHRAARPP